MLCCSLVELEAITTKILELVNRYKISTFQMAMGVSVSLCTLCATHNLIQTAKSQFVSDTSFLIKT